MKNTFIAIVLFAAIASAGVAFAQTPASTMGSHKTSSGQGMMSAEQMMSQCEAMMKDMRSDPVLMKHMNQIIQKHMMHGMMNGGSMMNEGMMKGGSMMNGGMMNGVHPSPTPHP